MTCSLAFSNALFATSTAVHEWHRTGSSAFHCDSVAGVLEQITVLPHAGGGSLVLTRPWRSMARSLYNEPERFIETDSTCSTYACARSQS